MTVDNAKKQNILIVHNYYQIPGGEDTVVANEKKMLEKHGHKVILYSRNNAELKQMSKLQKVFLPITTVFNPRTYRDIKKLIRDDLPALNEPIRGRRTENWFSSAVNTANSSRGKLCEVQMTSIRGRLSLRNTCSWSIESSCSIDGNFSR